MYSKIIDIASEMLFGKDTRSMIGVFDYISRLNE